MSSDENDLRGRFRSDYRRPMPVRPHHAVRPIRVNEVSTPGLPTAPVPSQAAPVPAPKQAAPTVPAPRPSPMPKPTEPAVITTISSPVDLSRFRTSPTAPDTAEAKIVVVNRPKPAVAAPEAVRPHAETPVEPIAQPEVPIAAEVVAPPIPVITEAAQPESTKLKASRGGLKQFAKKHVLSSKKSTIAWSAAAVVVVGLAVTGIVMVGHRGTPSKAGVLGTAASPVPAQYNSEAVGFKVYYPADLPSGWRIAPGSYKLVDGALTFTANTASGGVIAISEQAVPKGLDAAGLVPAPKDVDVADVLDIPVTGGKAALSTWSGKTLVSMVYGQTWIILNVTNLPKAEATDFAARFLPL